MGISADLGGRVGWLPKAERVKTLFLSPLQPQNAGAGGGGGGGVGGVSRLRFPPGPHSEAAVSADTHAFARLPPGGLRKNRNLRGWVVFVGKRPQAPGGPGPKPWGLDPATLTDFLQAKLRLKRMGPVSKRYHNPQSAHRGALDGFRRRSCTVP